MAIKHVQEKEKGKNLIVKKRTFFYLLINCNIEKQR